MFELANRLVGIYKTHDSTKSVTINPHAFQGALSAPSTACAKGQDTADEEEEQGHRKKSARTIPAPQSKGSKKTAASDGISHESKTVLANSTNLRV